MRDRRHRESEEANERRVGEAKGKKELWYESEGEKEGIRWGRNKIKQKGGRERKEKQRIEVKVREEAREKTM